MILGIDPGLSGALAIYDPAANAVMEAWSIPTFDIKRNNKMKRALNIHSLVALIRESAQKYPSIQAVIELVGAMPGQGVSSMFTFGSVCGAIDTAVVAAVIPFTKVTPSVWKKALACPADKDGALLRAGQLIPNSVQFWQPIRGERDKQDCIGIAEAALLAWYGAKNLS